jgi:hypothetical protein
MIKIKQILYCFLGGFVIVLSTFLWMSTTFFSTVESKVMKWVEITSIISKHKNTPQPNECVFIDVSKTKMLISNDSTSLEHEIITNTEMLAEFFEYITKKKIQVKYVFCDIIFGVKDSTKYDQRLKKAANCLGEKFLTIDTELDSEGLFKKNRLNLRSANAMVRVFQNNLYKIPLYNNEKDTFVPLKMYHDIEKGKFSRHFLYTYSYNEGISFNTIIPKLYLKKSDIEEPYIKFGLGEFVQDTREIGENTLANDYFINSLNNKFILIGDFESDIHNTYLNQQPGTLILFNIYWNLKQKKHIVPILYLFVFQIFSTFLLWFKFIKKEIKLTKPIFGKQIISSNYLTMTILIVLFSLIFNYIFDVVISTFHILILFANIDLIKKLKNKYITKKIKE